MVGDSQYTNKSSKCTIIKRLRQLTRTGEEKCKQDLESLQILAKYFYAHPGLQAKYSEIESEQNKLYISKGSRSKSHQTDLDLTVNNLIHSISNWI